VLSVETVVMSPKIFSAAKNRESTVHSIIYLVGLVVVVLFILSLLGLA
jgi:hypothetical protein